MTKSSEPSGHEHSIFAAFDSAPVGEPYTPEQTAELDLIMRDIAAGRMQPIPHEEVHSWLEERARQEAEVAAE